jgi:N utilization substance protein B
VSDQLAIELATAARRGEDLDALPGPHGYEHYREAAAIIRAANRDQGRAADPALLVDDAELSRIDRQFRRADALAALYEADLRGRAPDRADLSAAAAELAMGVWEQRGSLDRTIGETATGWRVERMPPVDRTILRIALWELRNRSDTPVAVVIAEAVRLAKAYSTEHSGTFVNGVLGALAAAERPAPG